MIGRTPSRTRDGSRPTDETEETQRAAPGGEGAGAGPGWGTAGQANDDAPEPEPPRGLRAQLGAVREAVMRLLRAHLELARAELGQVLDEVKRLAALAGVAIGALVLLGIFLPIGLWLFVGDWLFGSIGWGVLHGTFFLLAVAVSAGLSALGITGGALGRSFLLAVVIGVVIGVLFALDQPNVAWTRIGDAMGLGVDPGVRPLVVGVVVVGLALGLLGLVLGGLAGGGGGAIGGLIAGVLLGAILGAFSAITFGVQAGAAVGVTVGLLSWPILAGVSVARSGIDGDAIKARFWPSVTVETSKETLEWLRAQTPLGPKA